MAEPAYKPADDVDEDAEKSPRDLALEELTQEMSRIRAEAVTGRIETCIEEEWAEDEEYYEGIDDANRHEVGVFRSKPPGSEVLGDEDSLQRGKGTKSTIFLNLIRAYVDAGAARVSDMLLPTDDKAWQIKATPLPEMAELAKTKVSQGVEDAIRTEMQGADEGQIKARLAEETRKGFPSDQRRQIDEAFAVPPDADEAMAAEMHAARDQSYLDAAEQMAEEVFQANKMAKAAETRIDDWHVECQYHTHMRRVIDCAARIGTGVLKGPIPQQRRQVVFSKEQNKLIVDTVTKPGSKEVSVWNCFPDPGCGESIHDGDYHWEREDITRRNLSKLRSQPGYMSEQIDAVLREQPIRNATDYDADGMGKASLTARTRRKTDALYEIWYGYAFVEREKLEDLGVDIAGLDQDAENPLDEWDEHFVPLVVTMVNHTVIRLALNHLDTGAFPYDYMVWQQRADMPYGVGVTRQGRTSQRVINAAGRNMMDNAGLSGGPMWAYVDGLMKPMDGVYELKPRKGWVIPAEALERYDPKAIQHLFQFFNLDNQQSPLYEILQWGMKMLEDATGLPMLLQGQLGNAPDTVGGMTMLNNNASSVMRRIAKLFDDRVTEPHVRRYYAYLLQYGEDDEKGDFQVDARGSSALVERDLNNQALQTLGDIVTNPIFKKDPAKWLEEWMRSQKLDPKKLDYDDDDWKKVVEGLAQQAQKGDSSVEVAGIRAEAMMQIEQLREQGRTADRELKEAQMALQEQREEAEVMLAQQREAAAEEVDIANRALDDEFARLRLDEEGQRHLKEIKSRMAETVMRLKVQKELAGQKGGGAQVARSEAEPPGRAPDGEAFAA